MLTAGITAEDPYVVISGRLPSEWNRTIFEIGTNAPIYLRPDGVYGDRQAAGCWKAEMIGRLSVERFFEDDPLQADIIRRLHPNCVIVLVTDGIPLPFESMTFSASRKG